MNALETQLEEKFQQLKIAPEHQSKIWGFMELLKIKDEPTYLHTIRVALLAAKIGEYIHFDPKALLIAGCLHDVGKALIKPEILKKTEGFNEQDMEEMQKHPVYSYELVRGVFEFSAEIVLRHHYWQKNGYPKKFPKKRIEFSENSKLMIDFYARILSLADFYDAVTTRKNDKFGGKPMDIKNLMLSSHQDQKCLVEDLYQEGILV